MKINKDYRVLRRKWRSKKYEAAKRGLCFSLKFSEYLLLLDMAGLTETDIGSSKDKYCLGRYLDRGGYSLNNCRFITNKQNQEEAAFFSRMFNKPRGGGLVKDYLLKLDHHNSRGYVSTPWGLFKSLRLAEMHPLADCNHKTISKRIKRGVKDFRYIPYEYI